MSLLGEVCDHSVIENESEYKEYLATLRKKNGKSFMKNFTINNINLGEADKILKDYVTIHNKKYCLSLLSEEFVLEFDNNFTANIQIKYFQNRDITSIKRYLLYYNDCFKSRE